MILSKKVTLTYPQLSLLNRGLNFIPTRGNSKGIIEQARFDLQNYHRRVKLWAFYEDTDSGEKLPFMPPSSWTPPDPSVPAHIKELIKRDIDYFQDHFQILRTRSNLTPAENVALSELMHNPDIVIKPADKGSMVVVMDREQYIWEGNKQLQDTKYYKPLNKPIYLETMKKVLNIFQKIYEKKLINAKQKHYLIGDTEPRPRRFYLLPKIHKDPSKWSKPHEIPPGRPIVSDCSSETYRSAEFIDYFLNPLAKTHKSYIKDTYDFVQKIRNLTIPPDSILFTIDVDSLYTNIDIQEGIQAVKEIFDKNPNKHRPDKELLELLEINLTQNDFEFDDHFFLQIKGTAMGKKFAPAYADIFMASWETTALEKCRLKPSHYYRYLDDIWGVWSYSVEEFDLFLNTLNTHNPSIKLKATTHLTSIDFLDTTTYKGPNFNTSHKLDIKVYFKDTDTHALLHKSSFHPKHTFAGLIKSQLLRFHRICTRQQDFTEATKVLFRALSTRGYSRTFLRACFKTYQQVKPIQVSTALPLITTYSKSTLKLVPHIRKNFVDTITTHQPQNDIRIIAAYRKNRNLQDYLVRSKLKNNQETNTQHAYFKQLRWVYDLTGNRVFQTARMASIHTRNCVYMMSCKLCGTRYIGETKLTIATRMSCHKHNIIRHKNTDRHVVQHFIFHGWAAVQVLVLQCNPNWKTTQRQRIERNWINWLDTIFPRGLNERLYFRA